MVFIPFFKNALNVSNAFTANSSNVVFGNVSINSLGFSINSPSVIIGSNNLLVGNSTVFSNTHFSGLVFTEGGNSAIYNAASIVIDNGTSNSKINSSSISLDSGGNTFLSTVAFFRLGNSSSNVQIFTNSIFLKNSDTFLQPNGIQVASGQARMNTTTLSINSMSTAPRSTARLSGNAANLSVFNSTANGIVLAANDGSPISTNLYHLAGDQSWKKQHVWIQHWNWSNVQFTAPFTWPGNTFSTVDISGILQPEPNTASDIKFLVWLNYNGGTRTEHNYFYHNDHAWIGAGTWTHYVQNVATGDPPIRLCHAASISTSPFHINMKVFNSAGVVPFCFFRLGNFATDVGNTRIFEGWGALNSPLPNSNGVTGVQFFFSNAINNFRFSGNITITGTPY